MYEGGLRVPFAARWPARIKPASNSPRIALTMDMFPTALAAAGVAPPVGIDGVSLLPTFLERPEPEPRKFHYFIRREGGPAYGGKTIEALRLGDWKLLQDSPFAPLELYNLKSDPLETDNLAGKQRDIRAKLDATLRRQIQIGGAVPWQPAK
jgi:arylsulfatase A-like enzyme